MVVDDDTVYADVDDLTGDVVIEENQTTYHTSDGNVLMVARIDRLHDDYGTGETTGALDTNADGDALLYTAANVEGRIQITSYWYDSLDRRTTTAQYGTYGGSNFDRDGLSEPPASSSTVIVTSQGYATDGSVQDTTDPRGYVTRYEVDDAGRQTKVIRNYDAAVNSGNPSGTDDNVTVEYEYADGLRTKIAARMPSASDDQETTYTFGTTKGTGTNDSKVSTGHLLYKIVYPGATSDDDAQLFAYNAQGQTIKKKVGDLGTPTVNVLEWDFDDVGREEHERATTTATGFDTAVLRISTAHTDLGQVETVTQYDNATVGSGSVVDEVKYTYDGWGNVTNFEQDRNSTVAASGGDEYDVSYAYEKATAGRNTIRRKTMTMPDGQDYNYVFTGGDGKHDRDLSRVGQIKEDTTVLVNYDYLGQDFVVGTTLEEPDIFQKQYSGSTYPDLDRWNRVTDDKWTKDLTTDVDFHDLDITYDYSSNITQVVDNVQVGFDRIWDIDDIDRVTRQDEGTESSGSITSRTRDQQWTLAHTGNWDVEQLDLNGDSDFLDTDEHDDDRTHNKVNEITARDTDDDGTDDFTLSWDVAGNLADDGEEYEYVYDAWSRLREVRATSDQSLVAEYRYNGIDQRIAMHADTDDDGDVDGGDEWHYLASGLDHKILAAFVDSDVYPAEQHVHHVIGPFKSGLYPPRRIVFRDRDTNATGILNERLYYGSSWSSDVSTVFTGAGRPKEHVRYTAHGVSFGLPGGDLDSSGGADQADVDAIQDLIDSSLYSANADLDLDGDVDSADKATAELDFDGLTLGYAELSGVDVDNRYAWRGGYKLSKSLLGLGLSYHSVLGRDLRRYKTDPLAEQRNAGTRASSVAVNLGANAAAQTASPPHSPGGGLGEVGHVGDPPGGGPTIVPCGGAVTAHLTGFGYGEGANCVEAVEDAISNKIQDTFECDFCDLYQKCDLVAFDGSGPFGQDCQDKHGPQLSPVGGGPSTGVAATVGFGQGGFIVTVYCAECP